MQCERMEDVPQSLVPRLGAVPSMHNCLDAIDWPRDMPIKLIDDILSLQGR
jgi:hypothetical protein